MLFGDDLKEIMNKKKLKGVNSFVFVFFQLGLLFRFSCLVLVVQQPENIRHNLCEGLKQVNIRGPSAAFIIFIIFCFILD